MFPIAKQYQQKFRTGSNPYYESIAKIISSHESEIVAACQNYLKRYETEGRPRFAVDIDRILSLMDKAERPR